MLKEEIVDYFMFAPAFLGATGEVHDRFAIAADLRAGIRIRDRNTEREY
jgi:hypothetical protein